MFFLIRLLRLLLSKRWGWMILGVVVLVGGVALGASSHQVTYQPITKGNFTPYVVEGGTDYLQTTDGSTFYVIKEADLSPHFDGTAVFGGERKTFSILTRSDTEDVDVQLTDGTHLQGTGYRVERIAQIDNTTGQPLQTFTTAEYTQDPNGFYENNWAGGAGLIVLGLLALVLSFFAPRYLQNKRQKSLASAPAAMGMQGQALPYQQPNPYQQAPNPYQQPYQNPSQYPQYQQQQYPSYPPQPGGYEPTQLANSERFPPQNQ
ncbi:MAG TPA: hypothetical protein VJO32_05150 [Ktedonobacteraceae bacterium]|nr:hypothetical protein [Ktedonobacteraceae bacterium]